MKADRKPTWTHLVSEALKSADDFVSMYQLIKATGGTVNQVSAALHHLQKCKVVACMNSNEGLFWFYCDTGDTRVREHAERAPEDKPRRLRRNRAGNFRGMVKGAKDE